MTNRFLRGIAFGLGFMALAAPAMAEDVSGNYPHSETLLSNPKSIIGETITYPGGTPAQIVSARIVIDPGEQTGWHKHGVPLFVYILSGEVTVDYGDKGIKTYQAGTAFMEAMDQFHNGMNKGTEPVHILGVYMGAEGLHDVIRKK